MLQVNNGRRPGVLTRLSPALIVATSLLTACGGSWGIDSAGNGAGSEDNEPAVIESLQTRQSPRIKTLVHHDLGISRESPGSRHNDSYAAKQVRTPPGKVTIGVVLPQGKRVYYPEVEFDAVSGHRYQITWICIPFPYVALIDAGSGELVAVDSYCPDCNGLVGSALPPDSECLSHMQPRWLEPDNTEFGKSKWFSWSQETLYQNYRDLCFAAEHGLTTAMMNLAFEYEHGFGVIQKDLVRAYVWYRLAVNSGFTQAIADAERIEKTQLSTEERGEAERLLNAQTPGWCVKDVEFLRSHEPRYKVQIKD